MAAQETVALRGLIQRGQGEASSHTTFLAGEYTQSSIYLGKGLPLIAKDNYLKLMVLVLHCVWEDAGI